MEKQEFKGAVDQIYVPKEKVFQAIESGMKKTNKSSFSSKKKAIFSGVAAAALIGMTIGSGFVNPSMNKVLAKAPFIGQIYQEFGDSMGMNLAKQNLVTSLNQSLTKNGVTVKLTSAYFDGNAISITGHVEGDLKFNKNEEDEVSFDVNFENHKGDHDPWLDGMSMGLKPKGKGLDFHWQFKYPYKTIKENFKLPLTIHYINSMKGDWKFDIPISQKKFKTVSIQQEKNYPEEGVKIGLKEISIAKASSTLVYETTTEYKDDWIYFFKGVDNKGHVYHFDNHTIIAESKENDGYHKTLRKRMNKLEVGATSLTIYPELSIEDPLVQRQLDTSSFTLKSKRTDLAIKVNSVKQDGDKLILDYHFLGQPKNLSKGKLEIFTHNLGYAFTLVDKDYLGQMDSGFPPQNHGMKRNKVTLLDKNTAHFQSVFDLSGERKIENFKLENTVLLFNFSSFIGMKKLAPFTIEIPKSK